MSRFFDPRNALKSKEHIEVAAIYELAYTIVDVIAALTFLVGSFFFFSDSTMVAGTWLFVIGSVLFGLRPCIRLVKEYKLMKIGDFADAASV
ncbi:YrhK family protein [Corynebacterium gerontici]|uniref:YrhK domain-containing protein n=1 Tax=Corynebacterium gerontici TaxID=2079234 RepID=A0A3G6J1G1_9CORY|nr:YrhK family protein [Corynebacterium gerontici]AZA11817.1 hypothetical protein CGERO_07585 [Corynebacterium gerontici]